MATNFFFEAGKLLRQHNPSSFATKSERFKTIKLAKFAQRAENVKLAL